MTINAYSTHTLQAVRRKIPSASNFWLNLIFKNQVNFTTKYIDFEQLKEGRRIAPFVAPSVGGKIMREEGSEVKRFTPAYLKPKHEIDPERLLTRRAGEDYTGNLTPEQRERAVVADIMRVQKSMIERRWEVMAAEAAMFGRCTVSGEDYPTQVVDYGRDAGNTIVLTGTDLFTDAASKPLELFEDLGLTMQRLANYAPRMIIAGSNAYKALSKHADAEKLIDRNKANGDYSLNQGVTNLPDEGAVVDYKGTIGANLGVWTYSDFYHDDDGNVVEMMDPDEVILLNPAGLEGVRCFGAIMDRKAGYQAQSIYTKTFGEDDPSIDYVLSQSAPLMVLNNPNAAMRIRVV